MREKRTGRWMDGWVDEEKNGRMDGWTDGRMIRRMNGRKYNVYKCTVQVGRYLSTYRQTDDQAKANDDSDYMTAIQ